MTPPIHPPTHQIIHSPMGGGVSTEFKSSNRIELSWLIQDIELLLIWEYPNGVGGFVGGIGWGVFTNHKSSMNWIISIRLQFIDSNPHNNPPNYSYTHP